MIAIQEKLNLFQEETHHIAEAIELGSDAHLDLLWSVLSPLKRVNEKFGIFNESLASCINDIAPETLEKEVLPLLRSINKDCLIIVGSIVGSAIYRDVRGPFKILRDHHSMLREIIHDIQYYILPQNDELDDLLHELNGL